MNQPHAAPNADIAIALAFHSATSYRAAPEVNNPERVGMGIPDHLASPIWQEDWSIEPSPYKVYTDLAPIDLPREFPPTSMSALEALGRRGDEASATATPDLQALARLGRLSNGLLERYLTRRNGKRIEFRTAGGTGARYHLELYFVCGDLTDLDAGVYHYGAHDHALRQRWCASSRMQLQSQTLKGQSSACVGCCPFSNDQSCFSQIGYNRVSAAARRWWLFDCDPDCAHAERNCGLDVLDLRVSDDRARCCRAVNRREGCFKHRGVWLAEADIQ